MLLKGYTKKISKPACNSFFQSLHCIVSLDENIGEVLPYLSALLGGSYIKSPPSVSLKIHGRLIGVHPDHIAINALKDEEEADKVIQWIKDQINNA
jgi:ArsR family metal-binding transcriptional regulator